MPPLLLLLDVLCTVLIPNDVITEPLFVKSRGEEEEEFIER